jgi:hypothetical protein
MMRRLTFFALIALIVTTAGCWKMPEIDDDGTSVNTSLCNACLNAAPDMNALEITIPENDKSVPLDVGDLAEYYTFTVQVSRDLNSWILGTLSSLDEILSYPPTQSYDDTCVWGPFIPDGLSPVEMRFSMTKNSETDYEYLWDERLKNTDDEFTPAWGGHITPATDTARRGIGTLFIDYSALQVLDPTWDVSGRIDVDYDTYTDGRRIDVVFDQFVTEDEDYPIDADYHYHNHLDNSGEFSFEYQMDFPIEGAEDTGALETALQETQWHEDGEGLSEVTISGGDVTGQQILGITVDNINGYECWNDIFQRTYYRMKIVGQDGDETVIDEEGDSQDCTTF